MPTTSAFRPGGGGAGAIMGRLAETGDVRKPAGPPPAYRPMAEICLAQQVSGSAACSAQIPEGKSSAFQRVCSQCSLPEGFRGTIFSAYFFRDHHFVWDVITAARCHEQTAAAVACGLRTAECGVGAAEGRRASMPADFFFSEALLQVRSRARCCTS